MGKNASHTTLDPNKVYNIDSILYRPSDMVDFVCLKEIKYILVALQSSYKNWWNWNDPETTVETNVKWSWL